MKIGILTSSRADFGIYVPLLDKLIQDKFFKIEIIAFGTHLSKNHGFTFKEIEKYSISLKVHKISSLISNDDYSSITSSYGLTIIKFSDFWSNHKFDLVFCLGDRFEMSAAVQSGIPFGIKFAHLHGGETTLGAIDNIYRHQITLASLLHFTSNQFFSDKVIKLTGSSENVHNVGSISLEGIDKFKPIPKNIFYNKFFIPKRDFALVTFHPETIAKEKNITFASEMRAALTKISNYLYLIITLPNADTMGSLYRKEIEILKNEFPDQILCVESFGKDNYFTAMYYAKLLIGNTSSGIIEAASFKKYFVNVGERQKGRLQSENIYNVKFKKTEIIEAVNKILLLEQFNGKNVYKQKSSVNKVVNILKKYYASI